MPKENSGENDVFQQIIFDFFVFSHFAGATQPDENCLATKETCDLFRYPAGIFGQRKRPAPAVLDQHEPVEVVKVPPLGGERRQPGRDAVLYQMHPQ